MYREKLITESGHEFYLCSHEPIDVAATRIMADAERSYQVLNKIARINGKKQVAKVTERRTTA